MPIRRQFSVGRGGGSDAGVGAEAPATGVGAFRWGSAAGTKPAVTSFESAAPTLPAQVRPRYVLATPAPGIIMVPGTADASSRYDQPPSTSTVGPRQTRAHAGTAAAAAAAVAYSYSSSSSSSSSSGRQRSVFVVAVVVAASGPPDFGRTLLLVVMNTFPPALISPRSRTPTPTMTPSK